MDRDTLVDALVSETTLALKRAAGNSEALRGVVFLYLNRAYETGLDAEMICDVLGVSDGSILSGAGLSKSDEAAVMDAYETLDPVLEERYRSN